ncbi:hypothetical protein [Roseivivax sediminis]|uniref:hypothetical protein n=1 Tax=Roseivivax sediminis TaxID=936889 RepID=UPI002931DE9E|nr:hypothetical protein [Roseivivax sediminis]
MGGAARTPRRVAMYPALFMRARRARDTRDLMEFLRASTYGLSPTPPASLDTGLEFEEKHR